MVAWILTVADPMFGVRYVEGVGDNLTGAADQAAGDAASAIDRLRG